MKRVIKLTNSNGGTVFIDPDRIATVEARTVKDKPGALVRIDGGERIDLEIAEPVEKVVGLWQGSHNERR